MKTVLLTGSKGYLAQYVKKELERQGYTIREYDLPYGDILNPDVLELAMLGTDAVIHLAAAVRVKSEQVNWDVNALGTLNVVSACQKAGVKRLIFTSSCSVLKNKGPYGKSKSAAEFVLRASGLDYTIFRPTMIMGKEGRGTNNILTFITKFPFFIPMVGTGKPTRQPVYVGDVAKALVNSLENPKTYRKTYPLAGDEELPFNELVQMFAKEMGIHKIMFPVPTFVCKMGSWFLEKVQREPMITLENVRSLAQDTGQDTTQLKQDTGFVPTPLKETIRLVVK